VANPNHFATLGATGGPVSALNTNLLRSSDFLTGAFPAEYGNALSGVFDINFRNGNTEKFEFTGQVSAFSGLEFMAEGPLSKKRDASFVASYRYGIANLAATGTSAIPIYQDFSFKANFGETKLGRFELFGMGGLSSIDFFGDEIDETDLFANPNQDAFVEDQLALFGLKHTLRLNKNTYLQSVAGFSTNSNFSYHHRKTQNKTENKVHNDKRCSAAISNFERKFYDVTNPYSRSCRRQNEPNST